MRWDRLTRGAYLPTYLPILWMGGVVPMGGKLIVPFPRLGSARLCSGDIHIRGRAVRVRISQPISQPISQSVSLSLVNVYVCVCVCVCVCVYGYALDTLPIYTYLHTYIPTYIPTYLCIYLPTSLHLSVLATYTYYCTGLTYSTTLFIILHAYVLYINELCTLVYKSR